MAGRHLRMTALAPAALDDWPAITALLEASGLPTSDLSPEAVPRFLVVREGARVAGCVAVEPYGEIGLLRSLAVSQEAQGRGLGGALVDAALGRARALRLGRLVLLTDTAEGFFRARGWTPVAREALPLAVRRSSEFSGSCCACAASLWRAVPAEAGRLP